MTTRSVVTCSTMLELTRQISCVDVFAMPQSGTTVTVESVDHVFQTKMLDMLKQTGRSAELNSDIPYQADGQTGDGRRVVPLASRIRLLALERGRQYPTGQLPFASSGQGSADGLVV
jgi:hypothetical protein